jgi:2-polyprenyl-3-methyl-5-hydroxy-6-metoxy-1,4-benzoquinol methylase
MQGAARATTVYFWQKNGFSVVGVDYSEEALSIARENNERIYHLPIKYIRADLTILSSSLKSSSFDLILDYRVLHHLPDNDAAAYAKQCTGLLKSKGCMIIICNSEKDIEA